METHEKKMIRDNYRRLVENIDAIQLIPYLPCLLKYHREEVSNAQFSVKGSRTLAAIKLLEVLETRPLGFRQLVEALRNPEVDMGNIADRLDPPDDSSAKQGVEKSESTQKENTTQRLTRKPSKKQYTMETPFKHVPFSVINKLREMDAGQLKNADKLAEVIDLTFQEVENIKAHCCANDSLTIKYLQCWNEKEDITLQNIFDALDEVGRVDLIEDINRILKVNFKPSLAKGNDDVEDHGGRNDLNMASSLALEIPHHDRPQNVQPCSTGYPDVTRHLPNGIIAAGDMTTSRTEGKPSIESPNTCILYSRTEGNPSIQSPNNTGYSKSNGHLGMQDPSVCASSNLAPQSSDRVTNTLPSQQREDVQSYQYEHSRIGNVSARSEYTDNSKQVSIGSLESNDGINKKCDKQVKFTGYAPAELLGTNPSDCDRYAGKEREDSKKDKAGKSVGYSDVDILGAACNGDMTEVIPPQTIMENQRDSSKPLEHRFNKAIDSFEGPKFETPDESQISPRSELNLDSPSLPVFDQNNFDRSTSSRSSNTDNSAYASLSSNQDFDSSEEDKMEHNSQKTCEMATCVENLKTRQNEMGNFTENNIPSNESLNGTKSDKKSHTLNSFEAPTSDVVRRFENDLQNRPDDADWLMTDYMSTTSSKISNTSKENYCSNFSHYSNYSYLSEREDIDRPKLSIDSELNCIQRKARKWIPGIPSRTQHSYQSGECHESHPCHLNMTNDGVGDDLDDDEHVSVDGESPGVTTGFYHTGTPGDHGMNYPPELSPKLQNSTIPSQNQPYSVQLPPCVPNFASHGPGTLPRTNLDLPNANRLDNQGMLQTAQSDLTDVTGVNNQAEEITLQGTAQYSPFSVQEPPLLPDLNGVSHANIKTVDSNGNAGANKKSVKSSQEVEIVQQSEDLDGATSSNGRGILNSSVKLVFDVFKTTYDSLL